MIFKQEEIVLSNFVKMFFPILTQQYWFINAYLMLILLSPFINIFIKNISQKNYRILLIILFIINSLIPIFTYNPVSISSGNSVTWFVNLYLIAAYIKKYNIKMKKQYSLFLYFSVTILSTILAIILYNHFGLSRTMHIYKYNLPFALIPAVLIFLFFVNKKKEIVNKHKLVNFFASSTLAVYLIHENSFVRILLWKKIIQTTKFYSTPFYILYILGSAFIIFVLCVIIDKIINVLINSIKTLSNGCVEELNKKIGKLIGEE